LIRSISIAIASLAMVAGLLVGCGAPAELPTAPTPAPVPAPVPEPPKAEPAPEPVKEAPKPEPVTEAPKEEPKEEVKTEPSGGAAEPTTVEGDVKFELTSVTNPALRMGELIVNAQTEPGTEASVQMWFASGRESLITFRDKDKATADDAGKLVFDGMLGPIDAGIAKLEISLNKDGRTGKATIYTEVKRPDSDPAPAPAPEPEPEPVVAPSQPRMYGGEAIFQLKFVSATELVKVGSGDAVEVVIQTLRDDQRRADIKCVIEVTLPDGSVSSLPEVTTQNADDAGQVKWTWQVPEGTVTGDAEILVTTYLGPFTATAGTYITYAPADTEGATVGVQPLHKPRYDVDANLPLEFALIPDSIKISSGDVVTLVIQTLREDERRADIQCKITVTLPDGTVSSVPANNTQFADTTGQITWTWEVPAGTTPGDAEVRVDAVLGPHLSSARTKISYLPE